MGCEKDTSFKFSPQSFSVEDFLDLSHEEEHEEEDDEQEIQHNDGSVSLSHHESHDFSVNSDFISGELTVPVDDEAHLDWLSRFVEDSYSEFPADYFAGASPEKPSSNGAEPETPVCLKAPVPAKARSKRTRTGVPIWPMGSSSFADLSSSSPSCLIYPKVTQYFERTNLETKPPATKRLKRKSSEATGGGARRCSHCGVQKTPQWRAGPLGAKTLCNACGVRYKSGRLLPEYRPACSPSFSNELHSNHHRKVLEMRRKKEVVGGIGSGLDPNFD